MAVEFVSLTVIMLVAALVPIVARMIPGRIIPETVFLLIAGAILGPYVVGVIHVDETISFVSELGLAFLFLLAGFEIEPKKIVGTQGKHGLATWAVSLCVAALYIWVTGVVELGSINGIAIAIAMTTTALGTILPILGERKLMNTSVGDAVLAYGTWGELGPVIAMAFLLSTRSTIGSALVLLAMGALCVVLVIFAKRVQRSGRKVYEWIEEGSDTSSQTYVRFTVFMLVLLLTAATFFDLDLVLGAFAAGFVLRRVVPEENHVLEMKLNGMAHGFFIPLFFVVSGANVDITAIAAKPVMLVIFILLLVLVRGVPIFVSLSLAKGTRTMPLGEKVSVSMYCTTALPLIVALTSVAVNAGTMATDVASVLVAAGAITVFVMPLLALLFGRKG